MLDAYHDDKLPEIQAENTRLEAELQDTKDTLRETRRKLREIENELEDTKEALCKANRKVFFSEERIEERQKAKVEAGEVVIWKVTSKPLSQQHTPLYGQYTGPGERATTKLAIEYPQRPVPAQPQAQPPCGIIGSQTEAAPPVISNLAPSNIGPPAQAQNQEDREARFWDELISGHH